MSQFDYDVVVIGSGFGGSVAAMRAAEKGYRVGVVESGMRITQDRIPATSWHLPKFVWFPGLEMFGMQRLEVLDDTFVMCGAGVGGGSHVYSGTLYVPPEDFFHAKEWSDITAWDDELAPFYDLGQRVMGVNQSPYMPNDIDRLNYQAAVQLGRGADFNMSPQSIYFGEPGVEVPDPYFGGMGPSRTGCINCANCMTGCGHNAKNKLDANYLYLAEKLGAQIHELNEVYELAPSDDGVGFVIKTRHPGWAQRAAHLHHHTFRAQQVIVSAHAFGTAKLLTHMHHDGQLSKLSDRVGHRARTNSEQLISVSVPYDVWKEDPHRYHFVPGSVSVTSAAWPDRSTSCEPVFYGVGSDAMALLLTWHQEGSQKHPLENWLKETLHHPGRIKDTLDERHWSERTSIFTNMQSKDNYIDLYWGGEVLRSRKPAHPETPLKVHIPEIEDFIDRVRAQMVGAQEDSLDFELLNTNASSHFIGGMTIGTSADDGVIDPYLRAYGYDGLHIMDGSVMPANPGVNPSLTIVAMAERAMSMWPNKGDDDPRPSVGSSYQPIAPIMPHRPYIPASAPAALRLDVTKEQIIPKHVSQFGRTKL